MQRRPEVVEPDEIQPGEIREQDDGTLQICTPAGIKGALVGFSYAKGKNGITVDGEINLPGIFSGKIEDGQFE